MITNIGYEFDERPEVLKQLSANLEDMKRTYAEYKSVEDGFMAIDEVSGNSIKQYFLPVSYFYGPFNIYMDKLHEVFQNYNLSDEKIWDFIDYDVSSNNDIYNDMLGFKWFTDLNTDDKKELVSEVQSEMVNAMQMVYSGSKLRFNYEKAKDDFVKILQKIDVGMPLVNYVKDYYQSSLLIAFDLGLKVSELLEIIKKVGLNETKKLSNATISSPRSLMKWWNNYIEEFWAYGLDINDAYEKLFNLVNTEFFVEKQNFKMSDTVSIKKDREYTKFRKNVIQSFIGNTGPIGPLRGPRYDLIANDKAANEMFKRWAMIFTNPSGLSEKEFKNLYSDDFKVFEKILLNFLVKLSSRKQTTTIQYYPAKIKLQIIDYIEQHKENYSVQVVANVKRLHRDYDKWCEKLGRDPEMVYLLSELSISGSIQQRIDKQQNGGPISKDKLDVLRQFAHMADFTVDMNQFGKNKENDNS